MKLSTRPRYAIRLMLDISRYSKQGEPVHLREIATRNNLSKGYLEQLVVSLKNAQLIRSFSGRGGGYLLVRPPEQITILEIVEATIGQINIVDCSFFTLPYIQFDFVNIVVGRLQPSGATALSV